MNKTSIEWTDYSSNLIKYRDPDGKVVHGCVKVSPGCANCYASAISKRFSGGEFMASRQKTLTPFFDEEEARRILRSRATGKKVFVGDMTDAFGEWVPDWMLDRMFAVFALRPDLVFQVLTKRPERMRAYLSALDIQGYLLRQARSQLDADGCLSDQVWKGLKATLTDEQTTWIKAVASTRHMSWLAVIRDFGIEPPRASGPLPNVWLGVSVENQAAAAKRIPRLLETPAAVRFLSCEPLLDSVNTRHVQRRDGWEIDALIGEYSFEHDGRIPEHQRGVQIESGGPHIDWVIVGGESGPGARPCDLFWIRGIVGQCKAAGVPVFVKQLGSRPVGTKAEAQGGWESSQFADPDARYERHLRDRAGRDMSEWPEDLRVREFPR